MDKRPYFNGIRFIIRCPVCKFVFVNRLHKSCPRCKTGLKFGKELIFEGDFWWNPETRKFISYEELNKNAGKS